MTSVPGVLNFGLARRGGRKSFINDPAKVTLVSWPSFAVYNCGKDKAFKDTGTYSCWG
jgi:hypothetical protein